MQTTTAYRGVIMLHKAPIDKAVALAMLERNIEKMDGSRLRLEIAGFHDDPKCPPTQMKEWENEGLFPIDIGDEKYHNSRLGVGSATEYVVKHFNDLLVGADLSPLDLSPAEKKLVEMINKNNSDKGGGGGYLKGFHQAISWTMREFYEMNDDPSWHKEVMRRAADAVHAFLDAALSPGSVSWDKVEEGVINNPNLEDILSQTKRKGRFVEDPLTPGRYLRDLWKLGVPTKEIRDKVGFWVRGWMRIKQEQTRAREAVEEAINLYREGKAPEGMIEMRRERLGSESFVVILLEDTGHEYWGSLVGKFITKEASKRCGLLIAKGTSGHAVIMASGFDLSGFACAIKAAEPDKWHHRDNQLGLVLNGGVIYRGVQPTSLSFEDVLWLLRENPPKRRTNKNPRHARKRG